MSEALLHVDRLTVEFPTAGATLVAVDDVSFRIAPGELVGIVGESGSGKSVMALATLGLIGGDDDAGRVRAERLAFDGVDLQHASPRERQSMLGNRLAMIFQDPSASLNPAYTVAYQLMEAIGLHVPGPGREKRARALELLRAVEIPDPERRLVAYPHQLSGGMGQRVMIAMAIACHPQLLIADEPTTALDVTVQAQIVALLLRLQRERGMALVLISHDLGLVSQVARRVIVMYAGQVVEEADAAALFETPRHPYTEALLAALPERNAGRDRLVSLPGVVPGAHDRPSGCLLAPRCPYVQARCERERPPLYDVGSARVRCFFPLPDRIGMP